MNTLNLLKDQKEEWYAVVNFFSALSEYDFMMLLESITEKSGIGLDYHGFEFPEDKKGILSFYNISGSNEQNSTIRFSDFISILEIVSNHYIIHFPSDKEKVELLMYTIKNMKFD